MLKIVDVKEAAVHYGVNEWRLRRNAEKYGGYMESGIGRGGKVLRFKIEIEDAPATAEIKDIKISVPSNISELKKEEALLKVKTVKLYQELKISKQSNIEGILKFTFKDSPFASLITYKNVYNWDKLYKKGGIDALHDRRGNYDKKLFKGFDFELLEKLFVSQAYSGHVNISHMYKEYHKEKLTHEEFSNFLRNLKKRGKHKLISLSNFRKHVLEYIKKNPQISYYIKNGDEKYRGRYLSAMGAQATGKGINGIWQIDASRANIFLRDEDDAPEYRPYLYTIIDTYSQRMIMTLSKTMNGDDVAFAIARAIKKFGIPKSIKMDNGKEAKNYQLDYVFERLGIDIVYADPYEPQQKGFVERVHKVQDSAFRYSRGYIGRNVSEGKIINDSVPKWEKNSNTPTQLKGFLTTLEALEKLESELSIYENTNMESIGGAPIDVWNDSKNPVTIIKDRELSLILGKRYKRNVTKEGVSLDGKRYKSVSEKFIDCFGHQMTVVKDIFNDNNLYLYDINDNAVCTAYIEHEDFTPKAFKAARKYSEKTLNKFRKKRDTSYEEITTSNHHKSLEAAAYLSANTADTAKRDERIGANAVKDKINLAKFDASDKEHKTKKAAAQKEKQAKKREEQAASSINNIYLENYKKVSGR